MYRIICMSASISAFYDLSLNKQCVPRHSSFWTPWFRNAAYGLSCMHVFGINLSLFGYHACPRAIEYAWEWLQKEWPHPNYTIAETGLVLSPFFALCVEVCLGGCAPV